MTISRHTLALGAGANPTDAPLGVIAASVILNERRAPYVSASFEVAYPADPDTVELLHVKGGGLHGLARVEYRDPVTAAKITTWAGGPTITASDLTAMLGSMPISTATTALSSWFNTTERDATELPFTLVISDVVPDVAAGVIRITAGGRELRLMDYKYMGSGFVNPAGQSVQWIVNAVLQTVFNTSGTTVVPGGPDAATGAVTSWGGGVSAWDFLDAVLQPAGLTLQYSPDGLWRLITANAAPSTTVALDRVTRLDPTESRDDWGDAVLVAYNWTDPIGGPQVMADLAQKSATYQKTIVVEHQGIPYPGPGAAAVILDRAQTLARRIEVEAVSDYALRPGITINANPPGRTAETGRATAITFEWPDNRMTLTTTR